MVRNAGKFGARWRGSAVLTRLTLQVFGVCFTIAAIAMAAANDGHDASDNKSDGFAAVWTMLLVMLLSVGGTAVMRKVRILHHCTRVRNG
jgi:hypothetical protein